MRGIDREDLEGKLKRFYAKHSPGKERDVNMDKILVMMEDAGMSEHDLFTSLCDKYGVLYDPLDWKPEVIGKGTVNGAAVIRTPPSQPLSPPHLASSSASRPTTMPPASVVGRPKGFEAETVPPSLHEEPSYEEEGCGEDLQLRRQRLVEFYEKYNPTKLKDVDKIVDASEGSSDEEIFMSLCKKYNLQTRSVFSMLKLDIGDDSESTASLSSRRGRPAGGYSDFKDQLQAGKTKDEAEDVLRQEFAEWVSATLNLSPPLSASDMFDHLSNGALLCRLLHTLNRNISFKYHEEPANHFQELANIDSFLKAAVAHFGVDKRDCFNPEALKRKNRLEQRQVMTFFLDVAKKSHQQFQTVAPKIVKLEMEIEEEDKEVLTHGKVQELLQIQAAEKAAAPPPDPEEVRRREEEALRAQREAELALQAAEKKKRQEEEEHRAAMRAEEERLRRLHEQRKFEEEERARAEQRRKEEAFRRQQAALAAQIRDTERRKRQQEELTGFEEDNPVFQYKGDKYIADRRDHLDVQVGRVVNSIPRRSAATKVCKLKHGTYVIEYPKRAIFHVRVCRDSVMLRVGGGWMSLSEYLQRRQQQYPEIVPKFVPRNLYPTDAIVPLHRVKDFY